MRMNHLLDPELAAVLDQLPAISVNPETLLEVRAMRAQQMEAYLATLPGFPGVEVSERHAPGNVGAPDVRVLVYRPVESEQTLPALLWMHGGGYVSGRADWDGFAAKRIVSALGCCVVSVDYRLAPETTFPGPLEDCYAALQWLHGNASELRIDPARIGVAGASAGGGLAAALALLARDRGQVMVRFQALLQPMLDDRTARDSYHHPFAGEYIWTKEYNHFGWSALLGREPGGDDLSPYASPARAESLADLPPTFINVGSIDLFVEESIEYARRLIRDGVSTELHVYPGACHAFQALAPSCAAAKANDNDFITALRHGLVRP